jgi:hypothetical protein
LLCILPHGRVVDARVRYLFNDNCANLGHADTRNSAAPTCLIGGAAECLLWVRAVEVVW